jgi:hypothetical protein
MPSEVESQVVVDPEVKEANVKRAKYEALFSDVVDGGSKLVTTKVFELKFKSLDGTSYAGRFVVKRLTLGQLGRMAVIKAKLNGGEALTANMDYLHEMMAYCLATIIEAPDWWTPEEFYDVDLLRVVYEHVRSWEETFRNKSVG